MTGRTRIAVLGGGSGGLELACGLAARRALDVTLVDRAAAHFWKPRLHAFAAGTLDTSLGEIGFRTLARMRGFRFEQGEVARIDRSERRVALKPVEDARGGVAAPGRLLGFDRCVVALGGVTADFGVPGVREHAHRLDAPVDAEALRTALAALLTRARETGEPARIVIVGSGATGTELAANLRQAERGFFGPNDAGRRRLAITVLEAAPEIMPGSDEALRRRVLERLNALGIDVVANARVAAVEDGAVRTGGARYPSDATVWAAGLEGAPILGELADFELDGRGRIVVDERLRTAADPLVYAIGDAASLTPGGTGEPLPPTGRIASREARYLARAIPTALSGAEPGPFRLRDRGRLASLGRSGRDDLLVGGRFAKAAFRALEREHRWTVLGPLRGTLAIVADAAMPARGPAIKLHGG
jgi:NADH:ubiquinone reductase (H+-translocating)